MRAKGSRLRGGTRVAVAAALLVQTVLLGWQALRDSPTVDEVAYLPSGLSHWDFGTFDLYRANPPLVRAWATLPVLAMDPERDWSAYSRAPGSRSEFRVGWDFITANGERAFRCFTAARSFCIPFALLGGWICFCWGRDLYGETAGLFALLLWTFSPNILGHGHLITPDLGATAVGLTACYAFWHWLQRGDWPTAFVCGLLLGFAQLTKMTWVILYALCPALWIVWKFTPRPPLAQLGAMAVLSLFVLNLGYGFEGTFKRLGEFRFVSETLKGTPETSPTGWGNRFKETPPGMLPVPLPENYLLGVDTTKQAFEQRRPGYLHGEFRRGGWWYYYLYALGVKVPLGTIALLLLAAISSLSPFAPRKEPLAGTVAIAPDNALSRSERRQSTWRDELILLAPAIVTLIFVGANPGINRHLRYVLPIFPFAFIWTARIFRSRPQQSRLATNLSTTHHSPLTTHQRWLQRVARGLAVASLLWTTISSLRVFPHSLSYFNEPAGGPENGGAHLLNSNIDWGQDLFYLRDWLKEHPEARPLKLAYAGGFDPKAAGIDYELPPLHAAASAAKSANSPQHYTPPPGWYAISVNLLHGARSRMPGGAGHWQTAPPHAYSDFREVQPVYRAGYSIYVYRIAHHNRPSDRRVR